MRGRTEGRKRRSRRPSSGVVVVGTSGSGESTVAGELASRLGVQRIEHDELPWGSNWQAKPAAEFAALVHDAATGDRWVAAGNYASVRDGLWTRADAAIWLDSRLLVVLGRLLRRSVRRLARREVLWHGYRESVVRTFSRDSILWWALTTHAKRSPEFEGLRTSDRYPHLRWIVCTSPAEIRRIVADR